jgi:hypothetical protein
MPAETNKNHEKPKSGYPVLHPRSEPGMSLIQVWSITTAPTCPSILWIYADIYVM